MNAIKVFNNLLREIFANVSTFADAVNVSDIDKDIRDIIRYKLPEILNQFLGQSSDHYIIKGSVGAGKATKSPWIAIMDKEITDTTRKGVYIVFIFSSDYKNVYLTLNQGTTVPGQFGPRLSKKDIIERTKSIRDKMNLHNVKLKQDCYADITDERYKVGVFYYTLWDVESEQKGEEYLKLIEVFATSYFSIVCE